MSLDLYPLWLTLQLAFVSTSILVVCGLPCAYWLAFTQFRGKMFVEACVALPLVLPPTVLGFYLLLALGQQSVVGAWFLRVFDISLVFSFAGIVIGSVIYSLPFMVQSLQTGFEEIPQELIEIALLSGANTAQMLWYVLLPHIRRSVLVGVVLSFAHTLGEFGVVLMLGGNIPRETRVASLAVYDAVQALDYATAHIYSLVLLTASFVLLLAVYVVKRRVMQ